MKAVIPVAGLGTRMLPATKAIPKEMLPIVDKPLIQYVVDEAVISGVKEIVLVTHASKNSIENHFDTSFELEATLEKRVKRQLLSEIQNICPSSVKIMHVRQGEAKGLGHAILCAKPCIGNESFAVLLPDVVINQYLSNLKIYNLSAMLKRFQSSGRAQVLLETVPWDRVNQYGIASCNQSQLIPGQFSEISSFVEKPSPKDTSSNLSVVGRYVFPASMWKFLEKTPIGYGGEVQLTDAMSSLLREDIIEGYNIVGKSHDCGSKLGYMKANFEYSKCHPEIGIEFNSYINSLYELENCNSQDILKNQII